MGKNWLLIEPAITISQKAKLHLKAQFSHFVAKVYFVLTPTAMFIKHILIVILAKFKVQLAVLKFSHDIFSDKMRKTCFSSCCTWLSREHF